MLEPACAAPEFKVYSFLHTWFYSFNIINLIVKFLLFKIVTSYLLRSAVLQENIFIK